MERETETETYRQRERKKLVKIMCYLITGDYKYHVKSSKIELEPIVMPKEKIKKRN